jgi:hypothetical protein
VATPDTASAAVDSAMDTARAASIIEHVKENNIAYLLGVLISYQMGLLDQVVTYGTGVCG